LNDGCWWRYANLAEFQAQRSQQQDWFRQCWQFEQDLAQSKSADGSGMQGRCGVCGKAAAFGFAKGSDGSVNFREQLTCSGCGLISRQRVILQLLSQPPVLPLDSQIYLTEQSSLLYNAVRRHWRRALGSEYVVGSLPYRLRWRLRHLVRQHEVLLHQDVTALSFADASKDVVISCDVLEHVADYRSALSEMARVLRPGGRLLLTVPFSESAAHTRVRARIRDDGAIEHLEPPEYHGDPINPGGVLAFYNFGWDLLDEVRAAGFQSAQWVLPWVPEEGLVGALWTLDARR